MDTCVQEQMDTEDKLRLLKEGEIGNLKRIADASNASIFCTISKDELACHAIYKPIAGERPLWDFPNGNLASREVAAFLVSKEAGFNCVPTTVLRDGEAAQSQSHNHLAMGKARHRQRCQNRWR